MNNPNWIARFNPYQMAPETVRALAVGREALLDQVLGDIRARLDGKVPDRHLLLTGPRGAGKSYFLRLLEIEFAENFSGTATFVLLPEEQPNLFGVANLVANILERLGDIPESGLTSTWEEDGEETTQALRRLMARWQTLHPEARLLVIGVENFDVVLRAAFPDKARESVLRKILQNEPRLMLVATTLDDAFDNDSGKRLFRNFVHLHLAPWTPDEHTTYLDKRAELAKRQSTSAMRGKIRAYARFTGGSPRIGAALADLLLEETDLHGAAVNLQTLVDDLTDYYRNLWERVPPNSRKLLDALIRQGEPCSQSALAARVQAQQNQISRAFQWLRDMGYVREIAEKTKGRDKLYQVGDRLFVQFYRMRYIHPGAPTPLVAMSDLLADLYDSQEKLDVARKLMTDGHADDAYFLNCLGLRDFAVDERKLPAGSRTPERVAALHELLVLKSVGGMTISENMAFFTGLLDQCKDDASLQRAYDDLLAALAARIPHGSTAEIGAELVADLDRTDLIAWPQKMFIAHFMATAPRTERWDEGGELLGHTLDVIRKVETALGAGANNKKMLPNREPLYLPFVAQIIWFVILEEGGAKNAIDLTQKVEPALREQLGKETLLQATSLGLPKYFETQQVFVKEAILYWRTFGNERLAVECLDYLGIELIRHSCFEDAITVFQEVLSLCKETNSVLLVPLAAGSIAYSHLLLDETDKAWGVADTLQWRKSNHFFIAVLTMASAIPRCASINSPAQAFSVAMSLLEGLAARRNRFAHIEVLRGIFVVFLRLQLAIPLFRDILAEATTIFGEPFAPLARVFTAALDYLQQGAVREDWLARQDPDLATTVRAILEESGLVGERLADYPL
ncbi:MAG: ATP-binding protein [Sulfuricella sp.]|nr:ATP-binding protein [Sulfuricella sp.]